LIIKELLDKSEQEVILDTIDEHHTEFKLGDNQGNHETLKRLIEKEFNGQIVKITDVQSRNTDPKKIEKLKKEVTELDSKKKRTLEELEMNKTHYHNEINSKLTIYEATRLIDTI